MFRLLTVFFVILLAAVLNVAGHPALISEYPERIPGKSLQYLLNEWEPRPDDALSADELIRLVGDQINNWPDQTDQQRRRSIQLILKKNRQGDYRKRVANLCHDILDITATAP